MTTEKTNQTTTDMIIISEDIMNASIKAGVLSLIATGKKDFAWYEVSPAAASNMCLMHIGKNKYTVIDRKIDFYGEEIDVVERLRNAKLYTSTDKCGRERISIQTSHQRFLYSSTLTLYFHTILKSLQKTGQLSGLKQLEIKHKVKMVTHHKAATFDNRVDVLLHIPAAHHRGHAFKRKFKNFTVEDVNHLLLIMRDLERIKQIYKDINVVY